MITLCAQFQAVHKLVNGCKVPARSIAILSQYRAQTFQITERLRDKFDNVTVSTVVAAQGLSTMGSGSTFLLESVLRTSDSELLRLYILAIRFFH